MSDSIVLSQEELRLITGYSSANNQLRILHSRGFTRACRSRNGSIILERIHFEFVCTGGFSTGTASHYDADLSFMDK